MSNQPITLSLPALVSPHLVVTVIFWFVILGWVILTLVSIYHWLKYSHASSLGAPAILLHVLVSFAIMSFAFTGIL